ncbi:MAG: DUF2160 domain-containing protein [Litoreibacter sp.]
MEILVKLFASPAVAQGWGNVAKEDVAKSFSWTDPLWPSFWMAWTPATLMVFVGIFSAMGVLTVLEVRSPGGAERMGALGLITTRGDRLFISLLGTVYIFLFWLGVFGMPLWAPLVLAIGWGIFCFWKV